MEGRRLSGLGATMAGSARFEPGGFMREAGRCRLACLEAEVSFSQICPTARPQMRAARIRPFSHLVNFALRKICQ